MELEMEWKHHVTVRVGDGTGCHAVLNSGSVVPWETCWSKYSWYPVLGFCWLLRMSGLTDSWNLNMVSPEPRCVCFVSVALEGIYTLPNCQWHDSYICYWWGPVIVFQNRALSLRTLHRVSRNSDYLGKHLRPSLCTVEIKGSNTRGTCLR